MRHAERFEPPLRANKISLPPPLIDKAQKNRTFFFFRTLPLPNYVRVPIFFKFYVPLRLSFIFNLFKVYLMFI